MEVLPVSYHFEFDVQTNISVGSHGDPWYWEAGATKGPSININVHNNPNNVRKGGRGVKALFGFYF